MLALNMVRMAAHHVLWGGSCAISSALHMNSNLLCTVYYNCYYYLTLLWLLL